MRIMVMFDLPTLSAENRIEYTKFRKFLLKSGFIMMQESIYTKIALNTSAADSIMHQVRMHKPPSGLVQMLVITERQFQKMELIVGEEQKDIINDDERLIVL